uniref:Uncharacterized protein n=1 Tax=Magallana gigas TaxID=29159 RepID=A0A8W8M8I3_MAGGI
MKILQFHLLVFVGLFCLALADDAELQNHLDRLQNSVDHGVTSSKCEDLSVFNISCDKVAEYYIRVLQTSMCSVPQIANRCCATCSGPGHNSRR